MIDILKVIEQFHVRNPTTADIILEYQGQSVFAFIVDGWEIHFPYHVIAELPENSEMQLVETLEKLLAQMKSDVTSKMLSQLEDGNIN